MLGRFCLHQWLRRFTKKYISICTIYIHFLQTFKKGFFNTILSWKGFLPLGRLTFTAYLIHEDFIQVYLVGLSRMPFYYTKMNLATLYLVVLMSSFMMAFVGSIAIEMPFINLDREFLTRSVRRNKSK